MDDQVEAGPTSPAGWYDDPAGRHDYRYFNGRSWTADVADDGRRFVDPLPAVPPGASPTGAGPVERGRLGTAALVCGIIGLATSWLPYVFVVGAVLAVCAVVFGIVARRRSRLDDRSASAGRAAAGIVTGSVGIALAVVGFLFTVALARALDAYRDPAPHEAVLTSCSEIDGAWVATGELTNLDDRTRSFTVEVHFVRPGTDNPQRGETIELDDVEASATVVFESRQRVVLDDVDCRLADVGGPFPWGIEL